MIYSKFKLSILEPLLAEDIKVALLKATYMPAAQDEFFEDVSDHEVVGTGYILGGQLLTNMQLLSADATLYLDADDPEWAIPGSLSSKYAVFYIDSGDPETSRLLSVIAFPIERTVINGNLKIELPSKGFMGIR